MNYFCPSCETTFKNQDRNDPLPSTCPECGADLYPEEVIFEEMISSEVNGEVALV